MNISRVSHQRQSMPARMYALAATLIGLATFASPMVAAESLTICLEEADIRPWRTLDGKGLNFDLINSSAAQMGLRIEYQPMPWKRCLAELRANRVDGAFAASFKADRLGIGEFPGGATPDTTKRLHTDTYVVVRKKGTKIDWNGKAFVGLDGAIGIQLGYSVGDQLRSMQVAVDDGSGSLRELLLKLIEGRIAAAAILGSEANNMIRADQRMASQLEVLPTPLIEKPYYLMLSHALVASRPDFAKQFWNGIETARKSKRYQRAETEALQKSRL